MASEIRVDKINSLSGVGTVTLSPTGVDIAGITTAATLRATTGIVTSLTAGSLTSLGAVSGTTGTFTGNVAVSGANITLQDSGSASDDRIALGAGGDLQLFHDGSNSYVRETGTGSLFLEGNSTIYIGKASGGAENGIVYNVDGSVDLYYNNLRKFRTVSDGVEVNAAEGADAVLALIADEGDDNADYWRFLGGTAGQLDIASYSTGSWVNHLSIKPDGEVTKPNNPAASVYTNTSEQGGHGNEVSQGFIKNGGETFDISNDHGYVSNLGRFTCPVDGRYRVSFFSNISVDGLTGDAFNIQVMKNGGTVHLHYDMKTATSWQYMTISDLISCSANDYLQIYLKAGNGSSQGTIGVDGSSAQWNSTMYELVA